MYKTVKEINPESIEMKVSFSNIMDQLASEDENVIYFDSDVINSIGMTNFSKKYPDRCVDCGIQEANMICIASGASQLGLKPFTHTFGPFAARRVIDQIYISAAYSKNNIRMIGSDAGITAAYNGGTHMPIEDMGLIRTIPEVTIIEPTDSIMLDDILRQTKDLFGVFYIRISRKVVNRIFEKGSTFKIGKAVKLRDGKDVTLICSGICVSDTLKAADELKKQGIYATVLNTFTWKPIDKDAIIEAAQNTGAIITIENHNIINGLGSAVSEVVIENCPVPLKRLGVPDTFGEVGSIDYLKNIFKMNTEHIIDATKNILSLK